MLVEPKGDMGACVPLDECSVLGGVGNPRLIVQRIQVPCRAETDHESMVGVEISGWLRLCVVLGISGWWRDFLTGPAVVAVAASARAEL